YHRNVFLVDRQGALMLVGSSMSARFRNLHEEPGYRDIAESLLSTDSGSYQYQHGDETVLLNSRFIPELQWYLLVEQAEDPLLEGMRKTLYLNLAVGLLIAGGVLVATRFTVNRYQDRVDARTEELRVAKEVAENATKVKDSYVSLVSHNLRGPLATVKGYLQIALQEKNPDGSFKPAIEEWMQHSHNIAEDLIDATGKILDVSRLQTGKIVLSRTCFPPRFLTQQKITQTMHLAAKKRIRVTNGVPEDLRVAGDRELIGEALLNLLTNAIKFTKEGGSVNIFSPAPNIIAVQDTGVGVHPALLPGLFKHSEMTTTRGTAGEGGTGLGLPYSHDIMKAHGGTLTVRSEEGKGSIFSLEFGKTPPALLIVDGDARRRETLEKLAREMFGVEIRIAATMNQARESIAAMPPFMVAAGVDGHGVDGLALLKEIRATIAPDAMPLAIYSAGAIPEEEYAALDLAEIIPNSPAAQDVASRLRRYFS
ncbi:MAG: hypothetical protein HZA04_04040, partial [Nitrospinae bacterium]|nr:hypothetical protein [Nitrospinota bacterium]